MQVSDSFRNPRAKKKTSYVYFIMAHLEKIQEKKKFTYLSEQKLYSSFEQRYNVIALKRTNADLLERID